MVVRYPGTNNEPNPNYYGGENPADYAPERPTQGYPSSAREYAAAGEYDRNRGDRGRDGGGDRYGARDQANRGYGVPDREQYGASNYAGQNNGGQYSRGRGGYGQADQQRSHGRDDSEYHGSYASDGRRFEDVGRNRHQDDDDRSARGRLQGRPQQGRQQQGHDSYGRQPQGYDYDDRGFFARAGDEVRSWFGDDDAERRRDADARYDEQRYNNERDSDYHHWRSSQVAALDRDYDEYRSENRTKFHNEFSTWRTEREGQRTSLSKVVEHMEVVGSDGEHVGTVDKVRGDRILLTKKDQSADGRHHSIPSRWIQVVDSKVTLAKTAADAKQSWRDEEGNQAMFGDNQRAEAAASSAGAVASQSATAGKDDAARY